MIEMNLPDTFSDKSLPIAHANLGFDWTFRWTADSLTGGDGSVVTTWTDLSGAGVSMAPAFVGQRPTLGTIDGRRVINFDAEEGQQMVTDDLPIPIGSVAAVVRAAPTASLPQPFVCFYNPQVEGSVPSDGRFRQGMTGQIVVDPVGTGTHGVAPGGDAGDWFVIVHSNGPNEGPIAVVNGTLVTIDATPSYRGIRKLFVGTNGTDNLTGQIREVVLFNEHLASSTALTVCQRLMEDYGIS